MKSWLKENWFKFSAVVLVFLYLVILGYEQYRLTKVHNLDVANSERLCLGITNSNWRQPCLDLVKEQAIPGR